MEPTRIYPLFFGVADSLQARGAAAVVGRHPRFEIVGEASNSVMTVDGAEQTQPNVVVISEHSPGMPGSAVIGELVAIASQPLVIVIGPNGSQPGYTSVLAVPEHAPDALARALDATAAQLDNPDARIERRRGADRRVQQDWKKVFAERRVTVRRAADPEAER
ncbi:MAG: hypothetical protein AAF467_18575 [Actinomycetota bacterium]